MTNEEIAWLVDNKLKPRFPEWDPNTVQSADFCSFLRWYDKEVVKDSFRYHAAHTSWKHPKLKDLLKYCKKNQPRKPKREPSYSCFETTVYIQCVAKVNGHGALGKFVPILPFPPLDCSPDKLLELAQREVEKYTETYGGEWEVVQQADHTQMMGKSRKLQKKALGEE